MFGIFLFSYNYISDHTGYNKDTEGFSVLFLRSIVMAKNKMNKNGNQNNKQKFQLKGQTLPTPDKSADPPQPQGKTWIGEENLK